MAESLDSLLRSLQPISLAELDERAALLRRVDVKYIVDRACLARLVEGLAGDHDVLEIDDGRVFAYDTVYFDTKDLRCFRDHGDDVRPRFKARTRRYVDSGACVFEVKIKVKDGDTDKRQTDHPVDAADGLTRDARALLADTLHDAGVESPGEITPVLRTSFDRLTLAAAGGDARVTVDLGVRLATMGGETVRLRDGLALVETKSEDGDSPADHLLADLGAESMSLSKYRTGVDALLRSDQTGELAEARKLFG